MGMVGGQSFVPPPSAVLSLFSLFTPISFGRTVAILAAHAIVFCRIVVAGASP